VCSGETRRTVLRDIASTAAVDTAVLLSFKDAAERLCDEISLQHVDEFEDEEAGESAAEVADAVKRLVVPFRQSTRRSWTHVARRVM
jgi:hypothetical protein